MKGNVGKSNLRGKLTGVAAVEVALKKNLWESGSTDRKRDRYQKTGEDLKASSVLIDIAMQKLIQYPLALNSSYMGLFNHYILLLAANWLLKTQMLITVNLPQNPCSFEMPEPVLRFEKKNKKTPMSLSARVNVMMNLICWYFHISITLNGSIGSSSCQTFCPYVWIIN